MAQRTIVVLASNQNLLPFALLCQCWLMTVLAPEDSRPPTSSPSLGWSIGAALGWIVLTFAAAAIGSQAGPGDWYASLQKPTWNPPNWLFGPVWSFLYASMAIAAWRIWRKGGWSKQGGPLGLYCLQLLFNAAWSLIFFGLKRPDLAFAEITVLWFLIGLTMGWFYQIDRWSGVLFLPYFAWVSFAGFLNFTLWQLNR